MTQTSAHPSCKWPPALPTVVFLITFMLLYWIGMPLFADPDTPWHIATGDLIRHTGGLPATDSWSFTAGGERWYIISWVWDVLLSIVAQIAGLKAVYVFALLLTSFTAALLASNLLQRKGAGSDAVIFTLFFAGLGLIEFTAARPQLIAYVCVLVYQRILHNSREASSYRSLGWLPAIMLLWVNVHGSFIAGFTLIGAYGLEAIIYKRWGWLKQLVLIGAVCVLAALCNPYGIHMYDATMRTLHSVITHYIMEWLPFVFSNNTGTSAWFLVFLLASGLRDEHIPPADKIISVLWWIAMLFSMRNGSMFILVSAPYIALSLQRWVEVLDRIRTKRPDVVESLQKPGMQQKLACVTLAFVVASVLLLDVLKGKDGYLVDATKDPGAAIRYVHEHYAGKNFLNDYDQGGRIIYETRGEVPVFIDGRAGTAYPEAVLGDYLKFMGQEEGWQDAIEKYKVFGIIVANKQRFAVSYSDGQYHDRWKQVYHDDVASVFVRK